MGESLLTLEEVSRKLSISYPRAAELARRGILPVVHLGRQKRVDPATLQRFIENGGQALPGGWRRVSADVEGR